MVVSLHKNAPVADSAFETGATRVDRLIDVINALSHARDVDTITKIVSEAARSLTGADGVSVVLKDRDHCYYAEENAIAPLWKGRRFPMASCVSGWVMMNAKQLIVRDVYADSRIPEDLYRPTFVKSLAMVPIRRDAPIGAIGNYWATPHLPSAEEMRILQALADTTSVAFENVNLYDQLQGKIAELEASNHELSCFAWAASHDLQEPLRTIITQVEMLERHLPESLDAQALQHIHAATDSAGRLQRLIADMLIHAKAAKTESFRKVDLNEIMQNVTGDLRTMLQDTGASIHAASLPAVSGNPHLLECLMRNLLSNALKFRLPSGTPDIDVQCQREDNEWLMTVADNGQGIDPAYRERIFGLFQRLHSQDDYAGSGIGLATCRKIVELHGGRIWAAANSGGGSRFCFTLPVQTGD